MHLHKTINLANIDDFFSCAQSDLFHVKPYGRYHDGDIDFFYNHFYFKYVFNLVYRFNIVFSCLYLKVKYEN